MAQPKSHLEIALASIPVFTNDGTLDVAERVTPPRYFGAPGTSSERASTIAA
ncbi:MAG: hypothetical protein JF591_10170, partial [Lysobacter sp.]|nr:hypothetical protein [Lysobacter sp.]